MHGFCNLAKGKLFEEEIGFNQFHFEIFSLLNKTLGNINCNCFVIKLVNV
jgi:hypothetical protein